MRFAVCSEMLAGRSFPQACALASECGYEGIELTPAVFGGLPDPQSASTVILHRAAAAAGLAIIGMHRLLDSAQALALGQPEPAARARVEGYLVALAECCARLGGDVLVLRAPPCGRDRERTTALVVDALAPVVVRCGALGVRLSLQPAPSSLYRTVAEATALAKRLGPPVGVQLDIPALCAEGPDPAVVIEGQREAVGLFCHAHVADCSRRAPGSGPTDFVSIVRALHRIGYAGWLSLEVADPRGLAESVVSDSIAYLRACCRVAGVG